MVGLDGPEGVFQLKRFCVSMVLFYVFPFQILFSVPLLTAMTLGLWFLPEGLCNLIFTQ